MNNISKTETAYLEKMKNENYSNITSYDVDKLVSILNKVEPDVAKTLILQMPEAVRGIKEIEELSSSLLMKGIESSETGFKHSYEAHKSIIDACLTECHDAVDPEKKDLWYERASAEAVRIDEKDSEHQENIERSIAIGASIFGVGVLLVSGLFIGLSMINDSDE